MKKEIKGFICGVIATTVIASAASAAGIWDTISVLRNDINVIVNGSEVKADNFLYNDTTYLPLRVVAEAVGKDVNYDETTNTAYIGKSEVDNLDNKHFRGKYNPENYSKYSINIVKDNEVYYVYESDCRYLLSDAGLIKEIEFSSAETDTVKYVLKNGIEKTLDVYAINIGDVITIDAILFDDFVDEIEPLLR